MGPMEMFVKVPFALELVVTDTTLKVWLSGCHVYVLYVLLEVARRAIGALADGARQRFKAAHDPCTQGTKEKKAISHNKASKTSTAEETDRVRERRGHMEDEEDTKNDHEERNKKDRNIRLVKEGRWKW